MKRNQITEKIALVIALTAGTVVAFSHFRDARRHEDLLERMAKLETRFLSQESPSPSLPLVRSRSEGSASQEPAGSDSTAKSEPTLAENHERELAELVEVQAEVDEMRQALAERGFLPPDQAAIDAARQRVLDPNATSSEKLSSLRLLRSADARSDDVVLAMIDVYAIEPDPRVRADIFRQLDGVDTPQLREPLLLAVAEETAPEVREEAAETLAHFLPDHDVREWLEYLRENDSAESVRMQAERSLIQTSR